MWHRRSQEIPAPEVDLPETATAAEIDGILRDLAALRARWDDGSSAFCSGAVLDAALRSMWAGPRRDGTHPR
jgi:hypothetical protein